MFDMYGDEFSEDLEDLKAEYETEEEAKHIVDVFNQFYVGSGRVYFYLLRASKKKFKKLG